MVTTRTIQLAAPSDSNGPQCVWPAQLLQKCARRMMITVSPGHCPNHFIFNFWQYRWDVV